MYINIYIYEGFHKWGYPKYRLFIMENPINMNYLRVPPVWEATMYRYHELDL